MSESITVVPMRLEVLGECLSCDLCDEKVTNAGKPVDIYLALKGGKAFQTFCTPCLDKMEAEEAAAEKEAGRK